MYNVLDVAIYVINYAHDTGCGESMSNLKLQKFDKNDIKQIQEDFKGALRDYLPEKFRWNKHIGIYSYAWAWGMVLDQEDW